MIRLPGVLLGFLTSKKRPKIELGYHDIKQKAKDMLDPSRLVIMPLFLDCSVTSVHF
jgi:hypothetical protein